MVYFLFMGMFVGGYYCFSYGLHLWKHQNKVGGAATMILSVLGTLLPAAVIIIKS